MKKYPTDFSLGIFSFYSHLKNLMITFKNNMLICLNKTLLKTTIINCNFLN